MFLTVLQPASTCVLGTFLTLLFFTAIAYRLGYTALGIRPQRAFAIFFQLHSFVSRVN